MTGKTLTLDADSVNGDKIHGGSISAANLAGTAGNTITGYDITVGAGKTLDVSGGTLTLANDPTLVTQSTVVLSLTLVQQVSMIRLQLQL